MNRLLFVVFALSPVFLFGSDANVETDIFQRTVNFIIFVAILYYLLADKAKAYFAQRSQGIQAELEKVQELKKESALKVENAQDELNKAKQLATELIEDAKVDVDPIKDRIVNGVESEISHLLKSLEEKMDLETRKIKTEVVEEILEQLLSDDNIAISQDELSSIILSKVA